MSRLGPQTRKELKRVVAHDVHGLSTCQCGVRRDHRHARTEAFLKFQHGVQHSLAENRQRLVRRQQRDIELGDRSRNDVWPLVGWPGLGRRKNGADVPGYGVVGGERCPKRSPLAHSPDQRGVAILIIDDSPLGDPCRDRDGRHALTRPVESEPHLTGGRSGVGRGSRWRSDVIVSAPSFIEGDQQERITQ
jgi:hypothetical protein